MIEIERKFLVEGEFKSDAKAALRIRQGYLTWGRKESDTTEQLN